MFCFKLKIIKNKINKMKPFNKENESNSGENSIIQRASSLREEISYIETEVMNPVQM